MPPDLSEPLSARVQVPLNLETLTKSGFFALEQRVESSLRSWRVDPFQDGRVKTVWSEETDEPRLVELEPLLRADGPHADLVFPWPNEQGPNHVLMLTWHDADDDGRLDLVSAGAAEVVRGFARLQNGAWFYLTELNWVPELGYAAGRAEDALGASIILDSSHGTGWVARFQDSLEAPIR